MSYVPVSLREPKHGRGPVARLIYSMLMSLDGYIGDRDGKPDWAGPDEEVSPSRPTSA